MEENSEQPTLVNHALKFGVILGVISIVLTMLVYIIDYTIMADWKFGILSFVIYIGFTIYASINYRNEIGGFMPFGTAFKHGYLVFILSGLVATLFAIVLYHVIDPELPQKITDVTIENTTKMMEGFGAPEASIDEAVEKMKVDMPQNYTLFGHAKTYGIMLIVSAVFALITGAISKKKQPETF